MLRKPKGSTFVGLGLAVTLVLSLFSAGSVSAQATTHTITVTPPVNGTIKPGGAVIVADGANKRFTITPASNYHVADVLVDGGSVYGQLTWDTVNKKIAYYKFLGVTADHTIEASFAIDTKTLNVSKSGTGTGTVTSDVAGIDCGVDCSEAYDFGTPVVLTVAPDRDAVFQGWLVGGMLVSKASTYPVTMNKKRSVVAKFLKTYSLNLSMAGDDGTSGISVTLVSGKDFGHGVYKAGSIVAVKATPGARQSFAGWSGDASGTAKKITVTMNADKNITASFIFTSALKIAEKVSVVEAKSSVGALRIGQLGAVGPPACPDGTAYCNDQTNIYVEESSAETFSIINEILCKMAQAKYDEMLNKGPYKAQIDNNLCKSGKDSASGAGQDSQNQSSGAGMPDYELWTIDSSRADDNSPQIVKAWIHQKGNEFEPDMLISARVVITEGVSEENPYGLFTVNFIGDPVMNGQVVPFTLMKGFMKTEKDPASGKVLLKFTSKFDTTTVPPEYGVPPMTWIEKATLDKREDGTGKGTAYLYEYQNFGQGQPREDEVTFNFTFDPDYFHKTEVGEPQTEMCLDRNDFAESVWSYGLYNPDGSRVNRNSGFSIMKPVGDKDYYGWIGYWGIWFPENVTVNNDETVYKVTYGPGGTEQAYTVLKSGGKLKKYTLKPLTLLDIKNVPLDYSEGQGPQGSMYRVKWDGFNFTRIAKFDPATNVWGPIPQGEPTTIDLGNLSYDMLFFYSQALNGMVQVKLNVDGGCTIADPGPPPSFSCPASDSTPVNSYTEDMIYPSDTLPAELVCFGNCPDPAKLTTEDPYSHYDWEPQINVLPADSFHATYTFDSANMVLKSGTVGVVFGPGQNPAQNFQWGVMSGPLFDPSYLDLLACEMNPMNPADPDSTCGWKTWSKLPEYYVWEAGPNTWNQFTALKDPSTLEVLEFEPPLLVSYVHTWLDLTTSMFYLEYSGFGNLNGIPGKCVDPDTGDEMPCGPDSRWVPEFNIAEGSEVDDAVSGTPYFVKPLEMEQRMKPTETLGPCGNLPLTTYPLPSLSDFVDPNIGTEPVVEGPPAVIGGEIQESPEV